METFGVFGVLGGGSLLVAFCIEFFSGTLYGLVGVTLSSMFDVSFAFAAPVFEQDLGMIVKMFELWACCCLFHISFVLK